MSNSVKQISASEIIFNSIPATTNGSYFHVDIFTSADKYINYGTSTSISKPGDRISDETRVEINKLYSFLQLQHNWDSYGAVTPSKTAVENAIHFLLRLASKEQTPFFTAPSPDGDILIELKSNEVSLEFLFNEDGSSQVTGLIHDEQMFQKELNETTEYCSLKWLYCPDGNCFDWE